MSTETYHMISLTGYTLFVLFTILTIAIFIKFGIAQIISDLSGKKAQKQIRELRALSEIGDHHSQRANIFQMKRGKLTEAMDAWQNGDVQGQETQDFVTQALETQLLKPTEILRDEGATVPLRAECDIQHVKNMSGDDKFDVIKSVLLMDTDEEII